MGGFMSFQLSYECSVWCIWEFYSEGQHFTEWPHLMGSISTKSTVFEAIWWVLGLFRGSAVIACNGLYTLFSFISLLVISSFDWASFSSFPRPSVVYKICHLPVWWTQSNDLWTLLISYKACVSNICFVFLKEKRSVSSFDSCCRKLLGRSQARQSRMWICIRAWKPSQRELPSPALSQLGDPSGWSLGEVVRLGSEEVKNAFL